MDDVHNDAKLERGNVSSSQHENRVRAIALCDKLKACADAPRRRELYSTLCQVDKEHTLTEWVRRRTSRTAPVGSLVTSRQNRGFNITFRQGTGNVHAVYTGTATVIGQRTGAFLRHLMLHVPWKNAEGLTARFVDAYAEDLEVLSNNFD